MVEGLRSGRWIFRLPSGAALSTHGDYVRGVPHGTWETFWGNEKLRWRYSVVGGRLEGPAEEWAANGMKQSVGTFHEGRRDGEWTFWWSNGTKRASGSYRAGLRQGVWSSWHDNGQQAAIKQYKDDRLVTIIAEWDDWGTALYSRRSTKARCASTPMLMLQKVCFRAAGVGNPKRCNNDFEIDSGAHGNRGRDGHSVFVRQRGHRCTPGWGPGNELRLGVLLC